MTFPQLTGMYWSISTEVSQEKNRELHALVRALLASPLQGVTDLVPSYIKLYVEFDQRLLTLADVTTWVESTHATLASHTHTGRDISLPVMFDGEDLAEVALGAGLDERVLVETFTQTPYHVYALGFTAGFPFMGDLAEALRTPRKATPRASIPPHSVAIANAQVGVYPTSTPGGWNLLGHALKRVYDPQREQPFLLEPGDSVRFSAQTGDIPGDFEPLELLPNTPQHPMLTVLKPGLLDLVMDAGRMMAGRYGLVRAGFLDAHSASLANQLIGNPWNAPLIEMHYSGGHYEVCKAGVVACAGYGLMPLRNDIPQPPFSSFAVSKGDHISFSPTSKGKTAYLALPSGVESHTFLGSASVDLKAKLGRALVKGDLLGVTALTARMSERSFTPYRRDVAQPCVPLRLRATDQATPEALHALSRNPFSVLSADRMGVRLAGETVAGGELVSEPTQLGALQVTPSGQPILLLHDRGTLGGYTKPAVLISRDFPKAAQLVQGQQVRFVLVNS